MKNHNAPQLTLDQPAKYQIQVPGKLDSTWFDTSHNLSVTCPHRSDPVSLLEKV